MSVAADAGQIHNITTADRSFENVATFKYLRTIIINYVHVEIKRSSK
jgi:hypothetical protein